MARMTQQEIFEILMDLHEVSNNDMMKKVYEICLKCLEVGHSWPSGHSWHSKNSGPSWPSGAGLAHLAVLAYSSSSISNFSNSAVLSYLPSFVSLFLLKATNIPSIHCL